MAVVSHRDSRVKLFAYFRCASGESGPWIPKSREGFVSMYFLWETVVWLEASSPVAVADLSQVQVQVQVQIGVTCEGYSDTRLLFSASSPWLFQPMEQATLDVLELDRFDCIDLCWCRWLLILGWMVRSYLLLLVVWFSTVDRGRDRMSLLTVTYLEGHWSCH